MLRLVKDKNFLVSEFLFILYFWGFTFLKPLLHNYEEYSTQILSVHASVIVLASLFFIRLRNIKLYRLYFLIVLILFIFLIDYSFRSNHYISEYLYKFIIFGIIPMHLIFQIKNAEILLKMFSLTAAIAFLSFFWDPFTNLNLFADYMSYGFMLVVPTYLGIHIGRKYFKFKWMLPIEFLNLAMIVVFANRSAILIIIIFILILNLFVEKRKWNAEISILFTVLLIIFFFPFNILNFVLNQLNELNIYSFSLHRFQEYTYDSDIIHFFSGRLFLWENAIEMINYNIIFGSGTGSFQSIHGTYTHNIFLDVIVQYGVSGLIILLILLLNSTKRVFYNSGYMKILGILFFSLWFPKLLFSITFYESMGFWCFISYSYLSLYQSKYKKLVQ